MKVNAKIGGFNLALEPNCYPDKWRELMTGNPVDSKDTNGSDVKYWQAIILIGKALMPVLHADLSPVERVMSLPAPLT